ncbi:MAG TPA: ribonuclease D [Pseudomonadales bacterium]|nr:ribonuclease D [Pseudomonadales bacterium]
MTTTVLPVAQWEWIDCPNRLKTLCEQWSKAPLLAVDTEFVRVNTYYPNVGLIQVADAQGQYLIDPIQIKDLSAFADVICKAPTIKVLHSCGEDLEIFQRLFGMLPNAIFDTQIAAALVGYDVQTGLSRLVKDLLGVELPKDETRSDWTQRPLTQSQQRYAALDVAYLIQLHDILLEKLDAKKRLDWIDEECQRVLTNAGRSVDLEKLYLQSGSLWKLSRVELGILQALYSWRETTARQRNMPRSFILKESQLFDLARFKPKTPNALHEIEGLSRKFIAEDGQTVLTMIQQVAHRPEAQLPERVKPPLPKEARELVMKLRGLAQQRAQTLEVHPELLLKRRYVEALLENAVSQDDIELPEQLTGWRRALIGEACIDLLNSHRETLRQWRALRQRD